MSLIFLSNHLKSPSYNQGELQKDLEELSNKLDMILKLLPGAQSDDCQDSSSFNGQDKSCNRDHCSTVPISSNPGKAI